MGGLAVVLGLKPHEALLNDRNQHLIWFYQCLKRGGFDLRKLGIDTKNGNNRQTFDRYRECFNRLIAERREESPEAAALFYDPNRTGFNGLCRFNRSGFFNVPFGRYKTIRYREDFAEYADVLRNCELITGDFRDLKVRTKPDDFIYADPPYDVEFTSYTAGGFSWKDQEDLADWLAEHPGPVVASNQATEDILKLYRKRRYGFTVKTLAAPRRISCDGNRDDALEMLATRNLRSR